MVLCRLMFSEVVTLVLMQVLWAVGVRLKLTAGTDVVCLFTHACANRQDPVIRVECDNAVVTWSEKTSWTAKLTDGSVMGSGIEPTNGKTEMFDMLVERADGGSPFMCTLQIAREHTFVIENMHRNFSVVEIPESEISVNPEDGQYSIAHIEEIFDQGLAQSKLPSELSVPWAKAANSVTL